MPSAEYQREWRKRNKNKMARYRKTGYRRAQSKRYKTKNAEKIRAQGVVKWMLESGQMVKPDRCGECGRPEQKATDGRSLLNAHHPDYAKPKEVVWLCTECHLKAHGMVAGMKRI